MSKQVISVETGRQYFLDRVKELKNQVPNKDPFVFLGAFAVLNALGRVFNGGIYTALRDFGAYEDDAAGVIATAAERMFRGFTLTEEPEESERILSCSKALKDLVINVYDERESSSPRIKKLDLSHRDRQHLKRNNRKLTIGAGAFLEDVEKAINGAFDSIKDDELAGAKVFVKLNETPLIGYGE